MGRLVDVRDVRGRARLVAALGVMAVAGVLVVGVGGSASRANAPPMGVPAAAHPERIAVALARGNGGEGSGGIVLIDSSGRRVATLTAPRSGREDSAPAWSPDGRWLTLTRTTDGRRSFQIYVMRANGSGVRRVSRGPVDSDSAWSPDGRWIAYRSNYVLRVVHPDGTGGRVVPTPRPSDVSYPSWAPGSRVGYSYWMASPSDWPAACRKAGSGCGWVLSSRLDGTQRRRVVHGRDARWSPDGRTIVYTGPDGGVYTAPGTGGSGRFLGRGYLADWSRNGRQIGYTRMGDRPSADSVWIMNRDGSKPHRVLRGGANPSWQP